MITKKKKPQTYFEQTRQFIFLVLVVFLIRTFGFGLYQVPTGSMETTMLVGERFFADKFTYLFSKPQRGHIISFNDPLFDYSENKVTRLFQEYVWGPSNWTKRLIGLPGDEVRGKVEDGKPVIYVNGERLDQPFVNKYPLIGLWKVDPTEFNKIVEKEIMQLMNQRRLDASLIPRYREHRLGSLLEWRSYDPSVSYKDQPFYRITPDRLYPNAQNPDLKEPETPLQGAYVKIPEGKNFWNGTDEFYVKLGENQYWAMGDNRLGSQDSRFFGPLDGRLIHGKIVFRIWSLDTPSDTILFPTNMFEKIYAFFADWWIVDLIKHPIDFWTRVRWSRFFQVMK